MLSLVVGLQNLRRYFELIIFQAYLQSIHPDTLHSFETIESFVKERPGVSIIAYTLQLFSIGCY